MTTVDPIALEVLWSRLLSVTNEQQAALMLGIARNTLRLKLRDLGLSNTPPVEAEDDPV